MTLRPLFDKLLVREDKMPTHTLSGLAIPDSSRKSPGRGKVISVGQGTRDKTGSFVPMEIKPGDVVIYPPNFGIDVSKLVDARDEKIIMLMEENVLGIEPIGSASLPPAVTTRSSPSNPAVS